MEDTKTRKDHSKQNTHHTKKEMRIIVIDLEYEENGVCLDQILNYRRYRSCFDVVRWYSQ